MYVVKPLYPEINVRNLPTNMYEPKGYNLGSSSTGGSTSGSTQTHGSTTSSDDHQLKRLEIINSKLDGLICEVCQLIQSNLARLDIKSDEHQYLARKDSSQECNCKKSLEQENNLTKDELNDELLIELNRQQQSQQRRLNRLQTKLDELCEDLRLDHLISSTNAISLENKNQKASSNKQAQTQQPTAKSTLKSFENDPQFAEVLKNMSRLSIKKNKQLIEDLVVQVDPNEIPYSIFVQFQQLASNYRCFIQFHRHSTILNQDYENQNIKVQNLINLFNSLNYNLVEARNKYDYVLTVIFKNLNKQQPVLSTSALGHTSIHGESNILRYLAKLSNDSNAADKEAYSSKLDLNKRILIDEHVDKCTNELLLTGQRDAYLKGINGVLAKSQFLASSNKSSLADLYAWSLLKQSNVNFANLKQVNEWSERVEKAHPLLKLVKAI